MTHRRSAPSNDWLAGRERRDDCCCCWILTKQVVAGTIEPALANRRAAGCLSRPGRTRGQLARDRHLSRGFLKLTPDTWRIDCGFNARMASQRLGFISECSGRTSGSKISGSWQQCTAVDYKSILESANSLPRSPSRAVGQLMRSPEWRFLKSCASGVRELQQRTVEITHRYLPKSSVATDRKQCNDPLHVHWRACDGASDYHPSISSRGLNEDARAAG